MEAEREKLQLVHIQQWPNQLHLEGAGAWCKPTDRELRRRVHEERLRQRGRTMTF